MSPCFLKVASVSYEGSLFGWEVHPDAKEAGLEATMSFGFHCSAGSLKAIAVSESGRWMVCGGMDERIHIFNVQENRAIGELSSHSGAVSSLAFVGDTHLLSGSEDSTICIWRVHDWQCLHILGGHKSGVNSIAVHPSGKIALSASKDNTLKTWNLIHGRCAFTRRLRGPADKVLWHSAGEHYLLVIGSELQLYNIADNKVCAASFSFASRVNQAVFTNPGKNVASMQQMCIAAICDDKTLHIVDISGRKISVDMTALLDGSRARDMWSCRAASVGGEEMREAMQDEGDSLAIVTSNGLLTILSCNALVQSSERGEQGEEETGIAHAVQSTTQITAQPRLTAVVSWSPFTSQLKIAGAGAGVGAGAGAGAGTGADGAASAPPAGKVAATEGVAGKKRKAGKGHQQDAKVTKVRFDVAAAPEVRQAHAAVGKGKSKGKKGKDKGKE